MTKYRILTENLNRDKVADIVARHFAGFTIIAGDGHWKGGSEKSVTIEVIAERDVLETIRFIAQEIKTLNKQEAVIIELTAVDLLTV